VSDVGVMDSLVTNRSRERYIIGPDSTVDMVEGCFVFWEGGSSAAGKLLLNKLLQRLKKEKKKNIGQPKKLPSIP
jgi:hypothetical protein